MAKNLVVKSEVLNDFHRFLREPLENILGGKIVALRGTYELENTSKTIMDDEVW